jgi:phosphatidylserine decarboxylase
MLFAKNSTISKHVSSYAYASFSTFPSIKSNINRDSIKNLAKPKRKPFKAFMLITLGALLFISIKDYQETAIIDQNDLIRPTSWPLYLYSYLPLNTLSRLWGNFNNINLPIALREPGFKLYSYIFGVNLDEMQNPNLKSYKNLSEFFYRQIKPESRPIDQLALLVSPSDGKVLKFGKVDSNGNIEQVKGMTYKLEALLGASESQKIAHSKSLDFKDHDDDKIKNLEIDFLNHLQNNTNLDCTARANESTLHQRSLVNFSQEGEKSIFHPSTAQVLKASIALSPSNEETDLFYTVIYLAPGDYHRFHSPVTWVSTIRRHFVGELYSVAPYFQNTFNNLFVLNERVSLLGYWKHGFFSMTPVGATNVGSIKLNFDKDLNTNTKLQNGIKSKKNTCYEAHYTNASKLLKGQPLFKGQEMGGFMLGSTVVLVFEAPKNFKFNLTENQYVKMGQPIGEVQNDD